MSSERFCQPACPARFTLRQPKTSVRNATNVLKTIIMPFRRLCVLWHSLIRSLYFIYTSDTFRPILTLFTHFTLHQFFVMCVTTRNIFLIPNDAVARNLIIVYNVYNFSCQRPHLNYLFFLTFIVLIQVNFSWNVRDGPLGGGGGRGRAKYKKNFRARENQMKKIHARQLTLKNIHAMP